MTEPLPIPATPETLRVRMAELKDGIAAIKAQIASADIERQGKGGKLDPRWFHRAKTALRHKQRELEELAARQKVLNTSARNRLKDRLIEVVREDYDDAEWQDVMDEAHRRCGRQENA
ncbi:MAG: hypothetical protein OEL53_04440 [Rhodospirillales bacterium]|nr:hypothetical protein [Rhodospirillales bacterium]